jgi:hypothetical protein
MRKYNIKITKERIEKIISPLDNLGIGGNYFYD